MYSHQNVPGGSIYSRELQQRRRRRLRKRQLKCVCASSNFIAFIHLVQFVKCRRICLELDSKGPYQSSGEAKEGRCLVFTSSKKHVTLGTSTPSIRHFHVVVAQRRQGNAQKRVMDVQVCCFTNLNLLFLFLPLSLPSPSRRMSIESQGQLEDKANDVTFIMRYLFYWTLVFHAQ